MKVYNPATVLRLDSTNDTTTRIKIIPKSCFYVQYRLENNGNETDNSNLRCDRFFNYAYDNNNTITVKSIKMINTIYSEIKLYNPVATSITKLFEDNTEIDVELDFNSNNGTDKNVYLASMTRVYQYPKLNINLIYKKDINDYKLELILDLNDLTHIKNIPVFSIELINMATIVITKNYKNAIYKFNTKLVSNSNVDVSLFNVIYFYIINKIESDNYTDIESLLFEYLDGNTKDKELEEN